ncbi:MAG: DEAD/DEAH box helicase family protein [Coriobacteriia bacterium]|nr:DEAD/DEAH box helicase family protein [Coriobacteriia bacterium]
MEGTERERIVICRPRGARSNDPDADERYLAEPEWLQAAERFDADAHNSGIVTSQSPAREKIALYRSLFQGRDDVHAHGYLRKDGGIGYAPACANEWERGVCPRTMGQKTKCAVCDRRAFVPLTDTALVAHFRGESERFQDVVGLYVLDDESRTHLLVLDFDKDGWKMAIDAVRRAARPYGIEACIERSRSGNGGHAWFFFEEAVDARLAREFGSALIAEAIAIEKSLGFDAFDRMFPAQETIPEGGFGNLIAAPFQGRAQRLGNSVFVDEAFVPYPDQWLFLSGVRKLSEQTLRAVVPKTALVAQWAERLGEFLAIEHPGGPALTPSGRPSKRKQHVIGQVGGGKNRVTGIVDIATFQSLTSKDSSSGEPCAKDLVKNYGLVICDECHHAAAPQLELVLKAVRAKYVYGLSATPRRADGLDRALFMLCGPIRCCIDPRDQAKQQGFRRILKPRFTGIRLADYQPGQTFNQVLDKLCEHEGRNRLIAGDVVEAVQDGRRALVLTKRKEHARRLGALIEEVSGDQHMQAHVLVGEGGARQRREKLEHAVGAVAEGPAVIVATESYLDEGFDASALDALFLATPISWDGNVTQQAGRLHRCRDGKDHVEIYDYVDTTVPMLERMHKKRLTTYAKLGYEVETRDRDATVPRSAQFIQRDDAIRQLALDITNATESIRIVAPYVSPKAVLMLIEPLADAVRRGVDVACAVAKAPADDARARFAAAGIPLSTEKAAEHPGLAVFDKKIVWYGTVPLLAFPKADDCSLRLESAEAAHELLDTAAE